MHVLTVKAFDAFLIATGRRQSTIFGRKLNYRGELLLASTKIDKEAANRYIEIYDSRFFEQDPVEWRLNSPIASKIFAKAHLVDVITVKNGYEYHFTDIVVLDPALEARIGRFWWNFDLETGKPVFNYPISPENIANFYQICEKIDNGEAIPEQNPALFILDDDPRARVLRRGILKRINWKWHVIRYPHWKKTFEKRFGAEYVRNSSS